MMASSQISTLAYVLIFVCLLKAARKFIKARRAKQSMPPGPPGIAVFGNAFQLGSFQWLKFTEWKERYGPIFSLELAGQPAIVLNDVETMADFLDRRSTIYSDRPRLIMSSEIIAGGLCFIIMHYNDLWRRMRKVAHEALSGSSAITFQPLQEKGAALLAARLLQTPERWNAHIGHIVASSMLAIIYRWSWVDPQTDSVVQQIFDLSHRIAYAAVPGNSSVDMFPWMIHMPEWMAKWKRTGRACFRKDTDMFVSLMDHVKHRMGSNTVDSCLATKLIDTQDKHKLNDVEMAWLAGSMFFAGSETTTGTLISSILAMVLHPEVVRRAQAQLDTVVGRDRLPTFNDKPQLPYIEAIVKEVMRWRPAGPMGLPRRAIQDDWYKGYFIPKGTLVLFNIWGINRDLKHFSDDNSKFRPERYLNEYGELYDFLPESRGEGHLSFGSGRRVCAGKDVANQILFITIATLLWAFNIEKAVDACGEPIIPPHGDFDLVDNGVAVHAKPFKCSIAPRSPDVIAVINSAAEGSWYASTRRVSYIVTDNN